MSHHKLEFVQYLRAIAALTVVIAHCQALVFGEKILIFGNNGFDVFGFYGVDIFFFISGFISILCFISEKNKIMFKSKLLFLIGESSYSLYLLHWLVLSLVGLIIKPIYFAGYLSSSSMLLIGSISCVLCVIVGILNFRFIEKINLNIFKNIINKVSNFYHER